ncbi:MAG: acyl-CoA thioesterase [Granulosicoccus sp.]
MKLFFRLIWLVLTQRWRPRCNVLGPVDTKVRVYPNDLDVLLHVNNGVYLTYADLGRTDLMLRSNTLAKINKKRWYPVAAGATVEFRKSLKLGQVFTITTRVLGWDEKSVYMGQEFTRNNDTVAKIMIDARFVSSRGERISTDKILKLLDVNQPPPKMPPALLQWIDSKKTVSASPGAQAPRQPLPEPDPENALR